MKSYISSQPIAIGWNIPTHTPPTKLVQWWIMDHWGYEWTTRKCTHRHQLNRGCNQPVTSHVHRKVCSADGGGVYLFIKAHTDPGKRCSKFLQIKTNLCTQNGVFFFDDMDIPVGFFFKHNIFWGFCTWTLCWDFRNQDKPLSQFWKTWFCYRENSGTKQQQQWRISKTNIAAAKKKCILHLKQQRNKEKLSNP